MNTEIFTQTRTTTQAVDPHREVCSPVPSQQCWTWERAREPLIPTFAPKCSGQPLRAVESPPSHRILDNTAPAKGTALFTIRGALHRITRLVTNLIGGALVFPHGVVEVSHHYVGA